MPTRPSSASDSVLEKADHELYTRRLVSLGLSAPLVNGPIIAVLTARTPEGLRAMVITSVISINTLAAPLGFLIAGQVLEHWGVVPLFTVVVGGTTWMAIVFAAIVLRHRDLDVEMEAVAPELAAS